MPSILLLLLTSLIFTVCDAATVPQAPQPLPSPTHSKHFVLVHGSCHGAWSWFKLVPRLKSLGYNVTALDLAAAGINPQQVTDLRSINDYIRPLTDFMASLPRNERVVLVGHSFGGMAIALIMEAFPDKISAAVYLTALMPGPTLGIFPVALEFFKDFGSPQDSIITFNQRSGSLPSSITFGSRFLLTRLYQHSPIEDWTLASTLMRPYRTFADEPDLATVFTLTEKRYGSVKRVFIVTEKDLLLRRDFQQWMIRNNPPTETVEILGSDHMAMMSKPKKLRSLLVKIAKKYN